MRIIIHSIQFSSVQKIIQTINDKYYNNRSNLLAIYKVYSMSTLYTIMCANYALLIKTLIVNHVGLCKHFSYIEILRILTQLNIEVTDHDFPVSFSCRRIKTIKIHITN